MSSKRAVWNKYAEIFYTTVTHFFDFLTKQT